MATSVRSLIVLINVVDMYVPDTGTDKQPVSYCIISSDLRYEKIPRTVDSQGFDLLLKSVNEK